MKIRHLFTLLVLGICVSQPVAAQFGEKGLFKRNPKIKPSTNAEPENPSAKGTIINPKDNPNFPKPKAEKDEFDVYEKEVPKVRFVSQFEPAKQLNPVVHEDTSTIKEGTPSVVEQVDSIKIGDDWVQAARYYIVWDSRTIDPYNLSPLEFEENIEIKVFDVNKGFDWNLPLNKTKVTSQFGPRWGRWHEGMDIDATTGEPVYTTYDGVVRVVGTNGNGYGNFVLVRHFNGLETLYGHLSKFAVEVGQLVKAGEILGAAGNTGRSYGDHLHYENRYEGNPFSPAWLWDFPQQTILGDTFILTPRVWDHLRGGSAYVSESDISKSTLKHTIMHRVRRGETLEVIAFKYGLSAEELAEINRLETSATLRAGQQLRVKR